MSTEAMRTVTTAVKTIVYYLIFEILILVLVAVLFHIPLKQLFLPFVLYLIPGVAIVPLIFNARRYFHRPKACAVWFAIALSVFTLLITTATIYSAIELGLWANDVKKDLPLLAAFGCTISAVTGYLFTYRRLTAKRS